MKNQMIVLLQTIMLILPAVMCVLVFGSLALAAPTTKELEELRKAFEASAAKARVLLDPELRK